MGKRCLESFIFRLCVPSSPFCSLKLVAILTFSHLLSSFPYKESRGEKNIGSNSVLSLAGLPAHWVWQTSGFWPVNWPVVVKGSRERTV